MNRIGLISAVGLLVAGSAVCGTIASGTLYYTTNAGGENVWSVTYNYDGTNLMLGTPTGIAALPGADGIIFAPDGTLLVGEQGSNQVGQVTTSGMLVGTGAAGPNGSYHLSLDPSGNTAYSNGFGAGLTALPITGNVIRNGTTYAINGGDTGITSEAYAPGFGWFYVNGQPNGGGNVGTLDLSNLNSIQTTRLDSGVTSAHGLVYDPFTGLLTMFGRGAVGTLNPSTDALSQFQTSVGDFDQGAVDGQGHALIAGSNAITFIDYSVSGSITAPDRVISVGGFTNIDDVAPLSGLGSQTTPEPATFALIGASLLGLGIIRRRRIV